MRQFSLYLDYNHSESKLRIEHRFLSYVSGVSVCIFVALYLCMLGCLLQEPIRLKVL